ncbi:MAG: CHAD domain-containing protein [Proteobacteria bacterium]|nr:CHAD domain-containing protein [Pseudomonadota bacterium]
MATGGNRATRRARALCGRHIAAAGRALRGRPDAAAIHQARRELKRARAWLQLARRGLERDERRALAAALAAVARRLGAARDATVLRALVVETAAEAGLARSVLAGFEAALGRERAAGRASLRPRELRLALAAARRRLLAAALRLDGERLSAGFTRLYRRGRRALAAAERVPRASRLHEWRKHVKHYGYALEALAPAWPRRIPPLAEEARALADALGEHHDCALLESRLAGARLAPAVRRRLRALLRRRRLALRARALRAGARLYGETPRRLRARADSWWIEWARLPARPDQ